MKKWLWLSLTVLLISALLLVPVEAVLSPAMEILANEAEIIKTAAPGEDILFTDADLRQALGVTSYPDLTILSLPSPADGCLKLGGLRVSVGQVIRRTQVPHLVFTPANALVSESSFTFRAGEMSGGAAITCTLRFSETPNRAPTASGSDSRVFWQTRKNVSVFGTLAGYDPDGDTLEYLIVSYPTHGTVFVTGAATGDFRYTPLGGYTGEDSFVYVVRDGNGNYSAPATVKIKVEKREMNLDFDDLEETMLPYAASLVAAGVMDAEACGNTLRFSPDGQMTRAAFVVAAMKATGHAPAAWGRETCFDDNAEIPVALRAYLAAAQDAGYLVGELADGKLLCRPNDYVTQDEAYRILARMTGSQPSATTGEAVAVLAGIGCPSPREAGNTRLTRGQAAVLLWCAWSSAGE